MPSEIGKTLQSRFTPGIGRSNRKDHWKNNGDTHQHVRKFCDQVGPITDVCRDDRKDGDDKSLVVDDQGKTAKDTFHSGGVNFRWSCRLDVSRLFVGYLNLYTNVSLGIGAIFIMDHSLPSVCLNDDPFGGDIV